MAISLLTRNELAMKKYVLLLLFGFWVAIAGAQSALHGEAGDYWIKAERIREESDYNKSTIEAYVFEHESANRRMNMERRISNLKATKFHGAVYMKPGHLDRAYWMAGYKDRDKVLAGAADGCGQDCKLVAVISNACMMLAEPKGNTDISKIVVAYDMQAERSIEKAKTECKRKHGADCVAYVRSSDAESPAFCVGYDYGVYDTAE